MENAERLEVELPEELAAYVHGRVGQAGLATSSDVMSEAVRALRERDAVEDALRRMVAEADADVRPPLAEEEVVEHFRRRAEGWAALGDHA